MLLAAYVGHSLSIYLRNKVILLDYRDKFDFLFSNLKPN